MPQIVLTRALTSKGSPWAHIIDGVLRLREARVHPEKQSRDRNPGLPVLAVTIRDNMSPDSVTSSPPQCLGWAEWSRGRECTGARNATGEEPALCS